MAFKFVLLSTLLAVASAGVFQPITYAHVANPAVDAVASTHQNVVRSFDGTVSHYSKNVETPYSSVHKSDTRISNNVYTPAVAKTVTYAAPSQTPTAAVYTHAAPVPKTVSYAAPVVAKALTYAAPAPVYAAPAPVYAAPAVAKTVSYAAPAHVYHQHAAPAVATTTYNHGPAGASYTHNSPGVSAYGSSQTVHYSPAEMVSHMSFDGFGTHWGY
ncbi:larval/pupal cuticle protein H1C-like isoform X2 [Rhagoletis pomonella]|uniref:larval/pupal cuticle protein H1C-like isoform X2 n=1 Tax=Rhagoletis pomonella TaxID=28610 RepID=UPI00177D14D1|nr:larval/pupal cuticle protein H1C-like isoform X2 [Rhagoletis pomonella]